MLVLLLLGRSVVGEERIVVEERLRLWSIVSGRCGGLYVDVAGMVCCGYCMGMLIEVMRWKTR